MKKKQESMAKKDILIGVLLVITVISTFFAFKNNITGKQVAVQTGSLEIHNSLRDYVIITIKHNGRAVKEYRLASGERTYDSLDAGTYVVEAEADERDAWSKTVEVNAGRTTDVYPWMSNYVIYS